MADEDEENPETERRRRTLYLLLGCALSLLIPLLIVLYIRMSESPAAGPGTVRPDFAPRQNWREKVRPAEIPAPMAKSPTAPAGDSLGFIKGGSEYSQPRPAPPPSQVTAAPPAKKPAAPAKKQASPAPSSVANPKIHPSRFGNLPAPPALGGSPAKNPAGQAPSGVPDINALLKNIPGAAGAGAPDTSNVKQNQ